MGVVLVTLGFMLLCQTWTPVNFNLSSDMNIAVHLLLSAVLVWIGGWVIFVALGLFM